MNGAQQTVIYEQAMDLRFLDEIYRIPGGEKIKDCIQCGTCSGSCPVSWAMEETPRQVFAMIRAGMRDKVLDSLTIWTCASCYQCAHRCPQEIKITDIMYMLKRMAIRENRQRSKKANALSRIFVELVNKNGRNHETTLMVRFMLAANPFGAVSAAPIGLSLYTHGRLPLFGRKVRDVQGLRKIVAKAQELGGE
ncbi:MAG: 4Fe-4S dicluster domain-containing protein [Acidobacteria bacterium]|nr:4Fe-4S dicluster domain-containing protein [Acidobacteriota bacterium]